MHEYVRQKDRRTTLPDTWQGRRSGAATRAAARAQWPADAEAHRVPNPSSRCRQRNPGRSRLAEPSTNLGWGARRCRCQNGVFWLPPGYFEGGARGLIRPGLSSVKPGARHLAQLRGCSRRCGGACRSRFLSVHSAPDWQTSGKARRSRARAADLSH